MKKMIFLIMFASMLPTTSTATVAEFKEECAIKVKRDKKISHYSDNVIFNQKNNYFIIELYNKKKNKVRVHLIKIKNKNFFKKIEKIFEKNSFTPLVIKRDGVLKILNDECIEVLSLK